MFLIMPYETSNTQLAGRPRSQCPGMDKTPWHTDSPNDSPFSSSSAFLLVSCSAVPIPDGQTDRGPFEAQSPSVVNTLLTQPVALSGMPGFCRHSPPRNKPAKQHRPSLGQL